MTEETTKRPRGRPRKNPEPIETPVEVYRDNMDSTDIAAMQDQVKYQLVQLLKLATTLGVDLSDTELTNENVFSVAQEKLSQIYPTPPREDVTVYDTEQEPVVRDTGKPKPGTLLGNDPRGSWVPWTKNDLDPSDMVEFVPRPVPNILFPIQDEDGRYKILLDVNDLKCMLTVGVPCRVNRFFFNAYKNSEDSWLELERFKRRGPQAAPWGEVTSDGRKTWHFEGEASTFGLDMDGRYLAQGRSPLRETPPSAEGGE